ncbi:hypothetical protein [Rubinisphaera sp. JC750]|uniref:hypothetical protein n=1 Tax=Rubinisphaera sp. JC750 TaxID=2898658 RepID=UPI001F3B37E1|nr:hypothetical protein [Rubinisphaera sp. JC750]
MSCLFLRSSAGIFLVVSFWAAVLCFQSPPAFGQPSESANSAENDSNAENGDKDERSLSEIQQSISARYQRFSKTLTQLHSYMKDTDPARAEILMRTIGQSNEARVDAQLDAILSLLAEDNPQFGSIVERQDEVITSLVTLLDVLQSEDERKRLASEIERLEALIGDLNKLVVEQKGIRAGTERGRPTDNLEQDQQDVTDKTEKLALRIDEEDRERNAADREKSQDGESQDGKSQQGKSQDGDSPQANPQDGEKKEGQESDDDQDSENGEKSESEDQKDSEKQDGKSQESGESSESQSKSGEQSPSEQSPSEQQKQQQQQQQQQGNPMPGAQPQEGQQQGEQQEQQQAQNEQQPTPGREEVESAIDKMQKAIDELKEKNRDKASREQDRAIAELEKAKAKLEEILRQLREEEQKIILAALEARFRKMLQMQVNVRKSSSQIQEIPVEERLPRHRARSTQLARDEQEIVLEADKALILLREEGTSVAFPEAVMQLREDMITVTERLNGFEVDDLTIAIEDDIIEALDEMVEALRKEMEKLEDKQQQQQQQQQQQGDPGLVDLIAELKLLRSLQYRVNRRTRLLGRSIDGEQATEPELLDLLNQLSERQARIQRATYDLSTGRNE